MHGEADAAEAVREYAAVCRMRAAALRELASSQLQRAARWAARRRPRHQTPSSSSDGSAAAGKLRPLSLAVLPSHTAGAVSSPLEAGARAPCCSHPTHLPPLVPALPGTAGTCPSRSRQRSWRGRQPPGSCSGSCMACPAGGRRPGVRREGGSVTHAAWPGAPCVGKGSLHRPCPAACRGCGLSMPRSCCACSRPLLPARRDFPGGSGGGFVDGAGFSKTVRQRASDLLFANAELNRRARAMRGCWFGHIRCVLVAGFDHPLLGMWRGSIPWAAACPHPEPASSCRCRWLPLALLKPRKCTWLCHAHSCSPCSTAAAPRL